MEEHLFVELISFEALLGLLDVITPIIVVIVGVFTGRQLQRQKRELIEYSDSLRRSLVSHTVALETERDEAREAIRLQNNLNSLDVEFRKLELDRLAGEARRTAERDSAEKEVFLDAFRDFYFIFSHLSTVSFPRNYSRLRVSQDVDLKSIKDAYARIFCQIGRNRKGYEPSEDTTEGQSRELMAVNGLDLDDLEYGVKATYASLRLISAYKLVTNSKFERTVSKQHSDFIARLKVIVPNAFRSNSYPHSPIIENEYFDIVADELIRRSKDTKIIRPANLSEFQLARKQNNELERAVRKVRSYVAFVFDEGKDKNHRLLRQARLALLCRQLGEVLREDDPSIEFRFSDLEEKIDEAYLTDGYRFPIDSGDYPSWHLFERHDLRDKHEQKIDYFRLKKREEREKKRSS